MVGESGLGAQHNPWPACYFVHSLYPSCSCCSQSQDDNTISSFAAPFAANVYNQEIKDGSSWCDSKSTATFCSNWAHRAECLSHHIAQQMGWERTLLPETKEGHNHLQSSVLLDPIGKICCYRIITYSFVETVTPKKTWLGWVKKRDFEQMEICLHWQCLFSLTPPWVNFSATWSR